MIAKTYCDLYSLRRSDLEGVMVAWPELIEEFQALGEWWGGGEWRGGLCLTLIVAYLVLHLSIAPDGVSAAPPPATSISTVEDDAWAVREAMGLQGRSGGGHKPMMGSPLRGARGGNGGTGVASDASGSRKVLPGGGGRAPGESPPRRVPPLQDYGSAAEPATTASTGTFRGGTGFF